MDADKIRRNLQTIRAFAEQAQNNERKKKFKEYRDNLQGLAGTVSQLTEYWFAHGLISDTAVDAFLAAAFGGVTPLELYVRSIDATCVLALVADHCAFARLGAVQERASYLVLTIYNAASGALRGQLPAPHLQRPQLPLHKGGVRLVWSSDRNIA